MRQASQRRKSVGLKTSVLPRFAGQIYASGSERWTLVLTDDWEHDLHHLSYPVEMEKDHYNHI
jgi:hypothetical protein